MAPREITDDDVDLSEVILGGRYRLENLVGKGASSIVYRAHDTLLGQDVAIKVLRRDGTLSPEQTDILSHSLRNETRLSMRLSHPNVLRVFHFEQSGSWEYEVMEFVVGENLHQLVRRRTVHALSVREVVVFGRAVLLALEHAHEHGVIHNDLKPANIMLCRPGGIKVCDFGLARLCGPARHSNTVAGTPAFMSPERIRGEPGDPRSDLYSMGVTFFTLATGHTPFGDGRESLVGHLETPVPAISSMPQPLHDVIARAMAKSPAERYQSARTMLIAWEEMAAQLSIPLGASELVDLAVSPAPKLRIVPSPPASDPPSLASGAPERVAAPILAAPPASYQQQDRFVTTPSIQEPRRVRPPVPVLVSDREVPPSGPPRPPVAEIERPADLVAVGPGAVGAGLHRVAVGRFHIERTPVTNRAYARFVAEVDIEPPLGWKGREPPRGRELHPVTGVTLGAARAYARWIGRRLPTRSEWELAYGGPAGLRFPWGDEWRPGAVLGPHNGHGDTEPVGERAQDDAWGCSDLLGNVWEWTERDPRQEPPEPGKAWVCGGSFRHRCDRGGPPVTAVDCDNAYDYLGFRCAKDLP